MIINNAGGNKEFAPDPLLDTGREYEARILGIVHIGKHEKQKHDGTKFIEEYQEVEQAIIEYEITEDDTQVERGPEGDKRLENRRMVQFIKYSSHEKSGLFKLAQSVNPKAAYMEKKKGVVDTSLMIGFPVSLELKLNKDGDKTNIKAVNKIPPKYQDSVNPLTFPIYQYSVMGGAFPVQGKETCIKDVPAWMLRFSLDKAVDADAFSQLDEIEAHLEALEAAKDSDTELEGDRLPPKEEPKEEPKAEEPKEEPKVEEEPKEEPKPKRTRTRKPKAAAEDYSAKSIEELEALVVEKGVMTDDQLDQLNDEVDSDDAFKAGIIAALEAA